MSSVFEYCNHCCADSDNLIEVNGGDEHYCPLCIDNAAKECCHCDGHFTDWVTDCNGDTWCNDCAEENLFYCEGCNEYHNNDDSYVGPDDYRYCEACFDRRFTHCAGCSEPISRDDCCSHDGGSDYCSECFSERYSECEGCGETFDNDDLHSEHDGLYCNDCCNSGDWARGADVIGQTFDEIGSRRRFGVELETSSCPDHTELKGRTCFGAKPDGTSGVEKEFDSPKLGGDEGLAAVREFCRLANRNNFQVDRSCGFHAHFDCTDETEESLTCIAYAYALTAKLWASFVPKSRRENYFCGPQTYRADAPVNAESFRTFCYSTERYTWVNWRAFLRHRTVELRIHTGTVDADKVCNWVKAHTRFIDWASKQSIESLQYLAMYTVDELFDVLVHVIDDEELAYYLANRAAKFGTTLCLLATA